MNSVTLSVRVSDEMRSWLERFSKARGSVGGAAARLLEEARRREEFPAVEFRDTPRGRLAFVQGTRVQMAFVFRVARDADLEPGAVARHFGWPLWLAESAVAYIREFAGEIAKDEEDLLSIEAASLRRSVPRLEEFAG